jgi:hypothetical protein
MHVNQMLPKNPQAISSPPIRMAALGSRTMVLLAQVSRLFEQRQGVSHSFRGTSILDRTRAISAWLSTVDHSSPSETESRLGYGMGGLAIAT